MRTKKYPPQDGRARVRYPIGARTRLQSLRQISCGRGIRVRNLVTANVIGFPSVAAIVSSAATAEEQGLRGPLWWASALADWWAGSACPDFGVLVVVTCDPEGGCRRPERALQQTGGWDHPVPDSGDLAVAPVVLGRFRCRRADAAAGRRPVRGRQQSSPDQPSRRGPQRACSVPPSLVEAVSRVQERARPGGPSGRASYRQ